MNSPQNLDDLLRTSKVPERPASYWRDFPGQVMDRLKRQEHQSMRESHQSPWSLGLGAWRLSAAAAALLVIGFVAGHWHATTRTSALQAMTQYQKVYREMAQLFPNQVRAIVMDPSGMHLVLSDQANVPASQPVVIKVSSGGQTQKIITFSGQEIRLNGETCEVMTDSDGNVILVGRGWCWSSKETPSGRYRIEAQPLETML
jgi:hypothetical protein